MNEYEIVKLKKELQRKQELIKEEQEDRLLLEQELVTTRAERDKYHGELMIARRTLESVDEVIAESVKEMKAKLEQENAQAIVELQRLKNRLTEEKLLNERLIEEGQHKDVVISDLSHRLKELSKKYKDPSLLVNTKELTEQAIITQTQFYRLTEKYNKLTADMENIMAENKILRKLQGVPDNFGFDLEEIKVAEKQELEDYKAQCRKLEAEIEELQAERTQLRYRLRQYNTLYSNNKGERYKDLSAKQLERLDTYAMMLREGQVEFPQIDKSHREMQNEIIKLRGQVEVLQARGMGPLAGQSMTDSSIEKPSAEILRKFQKDVREVLEPVLKDIKKISESNLNSLAQTLTRAQSGNHQMVSEASGHINNSIQSGQRSFQQPVPLPGPGNDWNAVSEGYSYQYSLKIPLSLKAHENEPGYDTMKAKYEIASLQLQGVEMMKMLKDKSAIEAKLLTELQELQAKYQRCLRVQQSLFKKHFDSLEVRRVEERKKEQEANFIQAERDEYRTKLEVLENAFTAHQTKTDWERRCKEFEARVAISESEAVRLNRKYGSLSHEHKLLQTAYSALEKKSSDRQLALKSKLLNAAKNEQELTFYLNKILNESKNSVSEVNHRTVLMKLQHLQDQKASSQLKQAQLKLRLDKLQAADRQLSQKDETIELLREDNLELVLEMEIVKSRLEGGDAAYRSYKQLLTQLVSHINTTNISLMELFKKFDGDGTGDLNKEQFLLAIKSLGFNCSSVEVDILFSEFDLDGSNTISYKEFIKKFRRVGVTIRTKEEQVVYSLFKAITQAKISIKEAFKIIDKDHSGFISKGEMQSALSEIGIPCTVHSVEQLFRMAGSDNKITQTDLEKLYKSVVKESSNEQAQLYSKELDWKIAFLLKLDECSAKYHFDLKDTFKLIEQSGDLQLSLNELGQFINKAGIALDHRNLIELFEFLDKSKDGIVLYSEFLKALEQAKLEKRRVDRLKYIEQRTAQIRKEAAMQTNKDQGTQKLSEQSSLKVRLMALESKHSSLLKKNDKFIQKLVQKEQELLDLHSTQEELERSQQKLQEQYYRQQEELIRIQEKSRTGLSPQQSESLKKELLSLQSKIQELTTNIELYKGLYEGVVAKNNSDELCLGKIESERNKYFDIVKELQSDSDVKSKFVDLAAEIEFGKRREELINSKYEQVTNDIRRLEQAAAKLTEESHQKEMEIISAHLFMKEKSSMQQHQIDRLLTNALPTVTPNRVEEICSKINDLSKGKSQLEDENRSLKEKVYNMQLRQDSVETEKSHLLDLERRLKNSYADSTSVSLIELTKKLSEYKMSELKAKRQASLLREKEQYYLRVNHAQTDNIRLLEEELAQWETKFSEREEFWRKKTSDQLRLVQQAKQEAETIRNQETKSLKFFTEKGNDEMALTKKVANISKERRQQVDEMVMRTSVIDQGNSRQSTELQRRMEEMGGRLAEKDRQLSQLRGALKEMTGQQVRNHDFGGQMSVSTTSLVMQTDLTTSQLKSNARRFVDNQRDQQQYYKDELQRVTQAAQHSIDTLQRIIDEKNEQIKRKERAIEALKTDFNKARQIDAEEIAGLQQQVRNLRVKEETLANNLANANYAKTTQKRFHAPAPEEKMAGLHRILEEKDQEIRALQKKYDEVVIAKQRQSPAQTKEPAKGQQIEKKLQDLQNERDTEKLRHQAQESELRLKVQKLEALVKDRNVKLTQLQNTFKQLKEDIINEKTQEVSQESSHQVKDIIGQIHKGVSSNNSQLEVMLQQALQRLQLVEKEKAQYAREIQQMKEQSRMSKTLYKK